MRRDVYEGLWVKAHEIANLYSNPNREKNNTSEKFEVYKIKPLSEYTAVVTMEKNTKKRVALFFYRINVDNAYWLYFIPTDSHIIGMEAFGKEKIVVEEHNAEVENGHFGSKR